MDWILFVLLMPTPNTSYRSGFGFHVLFESKAACEKAVPAVSQQGRNGIEVLAFCISKK